MVESKQYRSANTEKSVTEHQEGLVYVICLLLTVIVWLVFGQTLRHGFVNFDDGDYVYDNLKIVRGLTIPGIGWVFTHIHSGNWHPLTSLSHMLDCELFGLRPPHLLLRP